MAKKTASGGKNPIKILSMRKKYTCEQTSGSTATDAIGETVANPYYNDNMEDEKFIDCMLIENVVLRFDFTAWLEINAGQQQQIFTQLQYGNRAASPALVNPASQFLFAAHCCELVFASGVGMQVVPTSGQFDIPIVAANPIIVRDKLTVVHDFSDNIASNQSKNLFTDIYYYKARVPHYMASALLNEQNRTG